MVSTRRRTVRTILMSRRACARYGLRGVRVGEASHPGLLGQGVCRAASVPEDVLDDLEQTMNFWYGCQVVGTSCQGDPQPRVLREEVAV